VLVSYAPMAPPVAKEEASLYEAGPTRRWLKVKQKGWTDAEDRWQRRISIRA